MGSQIVRNEVLLGLRAKLFDAVLNWTGTDCLYFKRRSKTENVYGDKTVTWDEPICTRILYLTSKESQMLESFSPLFEDTLPLKCYVPHSIDVSIDDKIVVTMKHWKDEKTWVETETHFRVTKLMTTDITPDMTGVRVVYIAPFRGEQ